MKTRKLGNQGYYLTLTGLNSTIMNLTILILALSAFAINNLDR